MSRSKAIAVLFYFGAMLIGAAAGIAADRAFLRVRIDRMTQDPRSMSERFFADLRFTPAQRAAADSIWAARRRADSILYSPLEPQRDSLRKATNASIRALLTPEQLQLFDERQAQRQKQRPNDGRR